MRFRGRVGFQMMTHPSPGVDMEQMVFHVLSGTVVKYSSHWSESTAKANPDLTLRNQIEVTADEFALVNIAQIRCVEFFGKLWEVTSGELSGKKIILDIGGLYHEQEGVDELDGGYEQPNWYDYGSGTPDPSP